EQGGGEWVADEYLELGHSEWGAMVNRIRESGCDVVLSNVVGDSVIAFYREFINQGLSHDTLPICATVTSEIEIAAMGAEFAAGSYTSFPYFQAIPTEANMSFLDRYRAFVKDDAAVTQHALECSYFQVYLWKQAVEAAGGEATPDTIREGIKGQTFDAPNGRVTIDPENLHAYLTPRIAQWGGDGQGTIIDEYADPIQPLPYVAYGEAGDDLFCTQGGLDTARL
ncbi:MAG: transporter substrate-binding protein, partial [Pseudomonadota bacterium]